MSPIKKEDITQDVFQYSPLHLAIVMNQIKVVDYLLEKGADVNAQDANGNSILSTAVFNYSKDKANYSHYILELLKKGADVNLKNNYGVSPKSLANTIANSGVHKFFHN